MQRPLVHILGVGGFCFTNKVGFGGENDGFAGDILGKKDRRAFCFIKRINIDPEQLDLLGQSNALTPLKFRDRRLISSRTILDEQYARPVLRGKRSYTEEEH